MKDNKSCIYIYIKNPVYMYYMKDNKILYMCIDKDNKTLYICII